MMVDNIFEELWIEKVVGTINFKGNGICDKLSFCFPF